MSDTRTYQVSNTKFQQLEGNLVQMLKNNGCDDIQFDGGSSGRLKFHHSIPFSGGNFDLSYAYDAGKESLSVTINDSPNIIPNSAIFDKIASELGRG
ncbi:MAG TPA: hypothetical protein VE093_36590 [Polyangiaceae bacterium]|jgi:hypothetical protein|nr:hypothetical protein [Polyangiaceae bacterium]